MFKRITLFASLICLLFLSACGSGDNAEPTSLPATVTTSAAQIADTATLQPTNTSTPTLTPTPTPEPTATPIPPTATPTPTVTATLTATELERLAYPVGSEVINRNRRVFDKVDSFHFEQSLSYSFISISYTLEYICDKQGEDFHCLSTFRETAAYSQPVITIREFVKLGDESWVRENEGTWDNLADEDKFLLPLSDFTFSLLDDFSFTSEVVDTNNLAGQPVYKVKLTPEEEKVFVESLLVLIGGVPMAWQNAEILVDAAVWIGQGDYLTYKEIGDIRIDTGVDTYSVYLLSTYSQYNQPVVIPDPATE